MGEERVYTSRRQAIVKALVEQLKGINGQFPYRSNVWNQVSPRLKFWDEVDQYPSVHVTAGSESRQYQGGGYKDRYLTLTVRAYVQEEDAVTALESLLEDIETVVEQNSCLIYKDKDNLPQSTHQISVVSIDTDEGVLEPVGVGEVVLLVSY